MKVIESVGRKVLLKATDFEVGKLSDKFGLMAFNKYEIRTYSRGTADEYTVFLLTLTSAELQNNIEVRLAYNTENKVALEKLQFMDVVDFENCLISHRANVSGTFGSVIQTIFANKFIPKGMNIVEAMSRNQHQPQDVQKK